ncbi:FkbM family methyltransferase [Candidatus Dependentiae bacterium]|nr:FkbM family methyltransferase [Candidatus Dependentiae bacterium]
MPAHPISQGEITKDLIKTFLPPNPVIVEAGAHKGRDTIKMAKTWPQGTIHSFEPVPELFVQLSQATALYPHITCYPYALSTNESEATLYVSSGASTAASSLLEPHTYRTERPEVHFTSIKVSTTTLDAWSHLYRVPHVDFLWLDMQGNELAALEGGQNLILDVSALVIEANLTERFRGAPSYDDILLWAHHHSFKPVLQDIPKHNKVNILLVASRLT